MKYNFSCLHFIAIYIFLAGSTWCMNTENIQELPIKSVNVEERASYVALCTDIKLNQDQECALTAENIDGQMSSMILRNGPEQIQILNLKVMIKLLKDGVNPYTQRVFFRCETDRIKKYAQANKIALALHISEPQKEEIIDLAKQYFNGEIIDNGKKFLERWFKFDHSDALFRNYNAADVKTGKLKWHLGPSSNRPDDVKKAINYRVLTYPVYRDGQLVYDEENQVKIDTILISEVHGTGYFRGDDGIDKEYFDWQWAEYGHATLLDVLSHLTANGLHPSPFAKPILIYNPHPLFTKTLLRELKKCEKDRQINYINAQQAAAYYGLNNYTDEKIIELFDEYVNDNPSMTQDGVDWLGEKLRFSHTDKWFNGRDKTELHPGKLTWFLDPKDGATEKFNVDGKLVSSRWLTFVVYDEENNHKLIKNSFQKCKICITYVAGMGFIRSSKMPDDIEKYLNWDWDKLGHASLLDLLNSLNKSGLRFLNFQPVAKEPPGIFHVKNNKEVYERHMRKTIEKTIASEPHFKRQDIDSDDAILILAGPKLPKKKKEEKTSAIRVPQGGINKAYHIEDAYMHYVQRKKDNHPYTLIKIQDFERARVKILYDYYSLKQNGEAEENEGYVKKLWHEYLLYPSHFDPNAPGISPTEKQEAHRKRTILNAKIEENIEDIVFIELSPDYAGNFVKNATEKIEGQAEGTWFLRASSARKRGNISYVTLTYKGKKGVISVRIIYLRGYGFILDNKAYASFLDVIDISRKSGMLTKYFE